MPLLFSYGTLQRPHVQLATFGRLLTGRADVLPGFRLAAVRIDDPARVAALGQTHHANAIYTGRTDDRVAGTAFDITDAELAAADGYERRDAYARLGVTLGSGVDAWVYVSGPSQG